MTAIKSGVIKRPTLSFRITEKRLRHVAFFRREQPDQLPRRRARQFFEQRGAIVRRHFVQNPDHLFVGHRPQQFLLLLDADVFKNVRGQRGRQDAEDDDLFVFGKIENHLRHVGRRPFLEKARAAR